MQSKIILALVMSVGMFLIGCGGTTTTNNNANANVANTNAANATSAANNPLEPTKKVESEATNAAPTLGPVVNAYYDALRRKDAAAVRAVMSQAFLKSTEEQMKEEKKTDIVAFLTEFDKIPETKMETRNEQISGNKGSVEVKGGTYVNWPRLVLVNEGGAWKLTNESAGR